MADARLALPRARRWIPALTRCLLTVVLDHVLSAYGDNGESAYTTRVDYGYPRDTAVEYSDAIDVHRIADDVVRRILADSTFAAQVARQLRPTTRPALEGGQASI